MFENIKMGISKYPGLSYLIDEVEEHKEKLNNLHKFGMVLIGPDSFLQKEVEGILTFYKEKGFQIVGMKTNIVSRTQTENLFLPTSTCVECGSLKWWMIQDAAALGNFCSVLFYSETATIEMNCLTQLNKYKGKSDPLNNTEGVVRFDFMAVNVCLNLIHIPDTYGDFFKDTSPFYCISDIINILSLEQINEINDQMLFRNEIFLNRLISNIDNDNSFESMLYKYKYLLAYKIQNENDSIEVLLMHYIKTFEYMIGSNDRFSKDSMFRTNISFEIGLIEACKKEIIYKIKNDANISSNVKSYSVLELLEVITDPYNYKKYKFDFFQHLKSNRIYVPDFDRLILETSLIQFR